MRIALRSGSSFHSYLAAGVTAYLVAQSVLIIGGNLRLLPLTGVTLPFVSYGGSSLLFSSFAVGVLLNVSAYTDLHPRLRSANTVAETEPAAVAPV